MFNFHHVSLSVSDIEKSSQFYEALGFMTVYKWKADDNSITIYHLKLGDSYVELFCYSDYKSAPESTKSLSTDLPVLGVKHFGLKVKSIEDAKTQLVKEGFVKEDIEIKKGRTEILYFFIADPDGILLEVLQDDRML